jgi:hypothetical protein
MQYQAHQPDVSWYRRTLLHERIATMTIPGSHSGGSGVRIRRMHAPQTNQPFRPLPPPTGTMPYHLSLDHIVSADALAEIQRAKRMAFHIIGDTGGVKAPQAQQIVAMYLENDVQNASSGAHPAFFYHLGDVVYYYGEAANYYSQFYEPYIQYPLPIVGIPGNHDGDLFDTSVSSLAAFVENFCAKEPHITPEAGDSTREAETQPYVYWTLEAPFATIVGTYTNVPEGGDLDAAQIAWLEGEFANAPQDRALLLAMHHPIYSADKLHSGSTYMEQLLEQVIQKTQRYPDAVFAGHVHNYQRFTRAIVGRQIPYIVAGAGGYWHLHYMQKNPDGTPLRVPFEVEPGTTLESYSDDRHGFLRLEVTDQVLTGTYTTVPRPQESWRNGPVQVLDSFTLNWREHRLQ